MSSINGPKIDESSSYPVEGDQTGAQACRAALQHIPAPETPDIALIFNPEGLSNHELEKLAELGTADALDKLCQALEAHQQRLAEIQQSKTGRNALVSAQKRRVLLLQKLIANCERLMPELPTDCTTRSSSQIGKEDGTSSDQGNVLL